MSSTARGGKGAAARSANRSVTISDAAIEAAYRRRDEQIATEPLAADVRYDRASDAIIVQMNNGAALVVPRRLLQGLRGATVDELQSSVIAGQGTAIAWPLLDVDFTVLGLLRGVYGGRRWMSELARHAGATTSEAKAAAARVNGRKGGRPRRKPTPDRPSSRKR